MMEVLVKWKLIGDMSHSHLDFKGYSFAWLYVGEVYFW